MKNRRLVFSDGEQTAIIDRWNPDYFGISFWDRRDLYVGAAAGFFTEQEAVEHLRKIRPCMNPV